MIPQRRVALQRLGLSLKHGAWQLHGTPQLADAAVDAVAEAGWLSRVSRWRRHRTR